MSGSNAQPRLVAGSIGRHAWSLSAPMVIGLLALNSYSIADLYFVGQLGTLELAAVSFTFPVSSTLLAIGLGVGIGASSVLSRLLGAGKREQVQRLTTHALVLGALLGLVVMLVGLSTIDIVFQSLGADERTLPMIREYMEVFYFGGFLLILPMVGNFAIRAVGDARKAALILAMSALLNIVLDPILIFGWAGLPALELRGAAIATVIANGLTVFASVYILYAREHLVRARFLLPAKMLESWRRLLHVGIPAVVSNLLTPLSIWFVTALVSSFGATAVAGFGVATRIEALMMVVVFSVTASMGPFSGQNYGAGRIDRIQEFGNISDRFCVVYGFACALLFWYTGRELGGAFSQQPEVIETARAYLLIVPVTIGGFAVMLNAVAAFNALGRPLLATLLTFMKLFLVYLPLAFLFSRHIGVMGVFAANAVSHVMFGIVAYVWLRRVLAKLTSEFEMAVPTQLDGTPALARNRASTDYRA